MTITLLVIYDSDAIETQATQVELMKTWIFYGKSANKLLADTDWWDASDTPDMSQAQIDYRQALRDITDNATTSRRCDLADKAVGSNG